jgi:hypothetical protein
MARNVDRLGRSLKDIVAFLSEADTFASRSLDLSSVNSLSHARVRQLLSGHLDRVRMQIASGGTVLAATPRAARQQPAQRRERARKARMSIAILWRDPSQGRGRALGRRPQL